jgi:hypothetical protein
MKTIKQNPKTWGRGLSDSFVRKGTHRSIKIVAERGQLSDANVFIAYSKDGSLNIQVLSNVGTVEKTWKPLFSENIPKSRRI